MRGKNKQYIVMRVTRHFNEHFEAAFEASNNGKAKRKFKEWFPVSLSKRRKHYKLYCLIDISSG